jgi:transcriptional regulator with XRE-family HTH domain
MSDEVKYLTNPEHPLKATFKRLGITQKQLAHFCGVSFQTLFQMLNSYRPMDKAVEQKLLVLLERSKVTKAVPRT